MPEKTMVRRYQGQAEGADGHDAGGYFKYVQVEPIPAKLLKRMRRCAGCYNSFYNHRDNVAGKTCWHLTTDENFRGKGQPKCKC